MSGKATLRAAARGHAQTGQSAVEYAVVCAALATALGIGMVDEHSVLRELVEALRTAYQKISFALSLPL